MIFTNKYYHWVQLVHVEADNYFILITSIDAKWLSKMIRKIRILNKASHCTLRCYNHCGHRNVPSEDRVFYGQVWVYFGPRHTSGGWRFRLYWNSPLYGWRRVKSGTVSGGKNLCLHSNFQIMISRVLNFFDIKFKSFLFNSQWSWW